MPSDVPRLSRPQAVLAAAAAALLAAGLLVGVARSASKSGGQAPTGSTVSTPATTSTSTTASTTGAAAGATTTTTVSPQLEAVLAQLETFVESARGLRYKSAVQVALLDDAAFRARLKALDAPDAADARNTADILRALGLVQGDVDLAKATESLTGDAVAGFYDPKTKELVVRGGEITPFVREVLAHELTHALDDQWFGLDRPALDKADSEAQAGFQGLTEGDAVHVQGLYLRSLPRREQAQAIAEENAQGGSLDPSIPPVLIEAISFPYVAGPDFVAALLQAGGLGRLDAAFADPPRSTAELLHPDRYLAGARPRAVPVPRADGPSFENDVMGEYFLYLVLAADLPDATARQAAAGWGGDHYVAWRDGRRTCIRDTFVMDTAAADRRLADGLRRWSADHAGSTVDGTGPVTLTACA